MDLLADMLDPEVLGQTFVLKNADGSEPSAAVRREKPDAIHLHVSRQDGCAKLTVRTGEVKIGVIGTSVHLRRLIFFDRFILSGGGSTCTYQACGVYFLGGMSPGRDVHSAANISSRD